MSVECSISILYSGAISSCLETRTHLLGDSNKRWSNSSDLEFEIQELILSGPYKNGSQELVIRTGWQLAGSATGLSSRRHATPRPAVGPPVGTEG
jgi:hypothetical protein